MFSFRGSTEEGERLVEKWGEVRDPSILRTEATPTNIHVSSVKGCINILRKPEKKTRTEVVYKNVSQCCHKVKRFFT